MPKVTCTFSYTFFTNRRLQYIISAQGVDRIALPTKLNFYYPFLLTSLISLCCCCKLCTVGCAVLVIVMAGLNVGLGCGLGTDTGVLLTGGCCFFLKESCNVKNKWN